MSLENISGSFFDRLIEISNEDFVIALLVAYDSSKSDEEFLNNQLFIQARKATKYPSPERVLEHLRKAKDELNNYFNVSSPLNKINSRINHEILYLPTYRRVEQDIRDFRMQFTRFNSSRSDFSDDRFMEEPFLNEDIHFGMSDIADQIKDITKQITQSSVEWFSKVSGEMLSQLVDV